MAWWKRIFIRGQPRTGFIYIRLPGRIEPMERGERFEDPLTEMLAARGLGEITGGGSSLSDPDDEGRRFVIEAGMDLEVFDLAAARPELRAALVRLGAPPGTTVDFTSPQSKPLQDRWTGQDWVLDEQRIDRHPAFDL